MSADAVAIASLVLTAIGAVAACVAAYFSWKAPSKIDLARVEQNTGHLEEVRSTVASVDTRLEKQEETDRLRIRANRISIAARGYQSGNVPLDLILSVREPQGPDFAINNLELYNESDLPFGSLACAKIGSPQELKYRASIPMMTIGDWFHSGSPDRLSSRRRLKIRVWMSLNGVEVSRDMAAIVIQSDGGGLPAFDVQANV